MPKRPADSKNLPEETPTLRASIAEAEGQLRERIEKGNTILALPVTDRGQLDQARAQYYTWDEYNATLLKRLFNSTEVAQEYSYWGIAVVGLGSRSLQEDLEDFHNNVSQKLRRLESISDRLPLYEQSLVRAITGIINTFHYTDVREHEPVSATRTIFVVHGRNDELKETVARFLGQLDLKPVILHEQPSEGRTVIEKFEEHSDASFAVVILTPDDVGRLAADVTNKLQSRARQNVIFEWGFFVAKLGRRKVCALYAEGVELPSDLNGVIYIELDSKGAWKLVLTRELKAAGIEVDLNRAI